MTSALLLFMTGFFPPVLAAFLIVAGMYVYFTRREKPGQKQSKTGQAVNAQAGTLSASAQFEAQQRARQWLSYAQNLETYATQVEAQAKGAPNEQELGAYAKRLREYAERIRKQVV